MTNPSATMVPDHASAHHSRCRVLVGTNRDAGPAERGERGVDIIDDGGGMVYLRDADLPRVIALLAQHLDGATVRMVAQESVESWADSDTLDEALADVETHLQILHTRRAAILQRIATVEA